MRGFSRAGRVGASWLVVVVMAVLAMGAADNAARYNNIGNDLMCTCGCGQVLMQCNHLGCPALTKEGAELSAMIDAGKSDNAILIAFQDEYGPTVLAAPMLTKFNMIAWIVPPAFLVLGIIGVVMLVRRWRRRIAARPAAEHDARFLAMRDKIRKETQL
ncbi:MAG: cytochrome c-type biogenesis protein CcmH [Acidobacteriaceae bacterium]